MLGIFLVKGSAWEAPLEANAQHQRKKELQSLRAAARMKGVNTAMFFCFSTLVSLCAFVTFALTGNQLDYSRVVQALGFFQVFRLTVTVYIPSAVQSLSNAVYHTDESGLFETQNGIIRRLGTVEKFNTKPDTRSSDTTEDCLIEISNGYFAWKKTDSAKEESDDADKKSIRRDSLSLDDSKFGIDLPEIAANDEKPWKNCVLENIHLKLNKGELVAVVGAVGSGNCPLSCSPR